MARAAASYIVKRHLTKRLLSTTSIIHPPRIPSAHQYLFSSSVTPPFSQAVRSLPTRFTSIRCSSGSPLNMVSTLGDWELTECSLVFPGMDFEHWQILMDEPGGEGATKQEMIDCYIKTLAKVVGSDEEAKKKIYKVNCDPKGCVDIGFGCEIDWETAIKLEELPGVYGTLPDCYTDPEHKDYGGELFVNGEIVQRSPERERRAQTYPRPRLDNLPGGTFE